jgi:23S rRNA (adenine2503-C2)-methyltransferase
VLEVLEALPGLYSWDHFIPSLSTIAPVGTGKFFDKLLEIKQKLFAETFQLQFSLHSTSLDQRNEWMPVKKWGFEEIAAYGRKFYQPRGKKITLNFAVAENTVLQPSELARHFSPDIFLVKLTPVNPTYKAQSNRIVSAISRDGLPGEELASGILSEGFEVILSLGEFEENLIGSNCGQYLQSYLRFCEKLPEAYAYDLVSDPE